MTRSLSLRARLTLIILAPLLLISLAIAIWAARDAQARAAERFDSSLLVTALGISRDTAFTGGNALSRETRDLLRDTSGGPVFYHVYAPDGVFVTGYATPPVPPEPEAESEPTYTYFDAEYQRQPVRAVRFSDTMTIDGLTGEFTFTVWQNLSLRDDFVQSLSQRTYVVMASLIMAVGLIVWFGVRIGLRPLQDLENAISLRSAADLSPIRRRIPVEVGGIVGRFNQLVSELSGTLRRKDEFISDAAHQLRNPIAGVVALSQAVASAKTFEEVGPRSDDLLQAVDHAARLTEDLLTLERAKSAGPIDALDPVDAGQIVAAVLDRFADTARTRGVELQLSQTGRGTRIRVDATLLDQAITNLLTNALTHGGAQLSQIHTRVDAGPDRISITIADNGKGLDSANYDTALARFKQVSPAEGSGLGLPIAQSVAASAHGSLRLGSADPGLTVTLDFPTVPGSGPARTSGEAPAPRAKAQPSTA